MIIARKAENWRKMEREKYVRLFIEIRLLGGAQK